MTIRFIFANAPTAERLAVRPHHTGRCHCGTVQFTVRLDAEGMTPCRCNCSICRRRGAVMAFVDLADFVVDRGAEHLTAYQFNTRIARHYFCSRCGIYTHHQRRSVPTQFAFNLACLDGIDPLTLRHVPVIDGSRHHPSDGAAHCDDR